MTDEERIRRVANGDRLAFEQLYDQYERLVYSIALKVIRDPHLAEEIVQDLFIKIWTHADRYEPGRGRLSSWLINMTRNLAIDRVRTTRARGMVPFVRPDEPVREISDETCAALADTTVNTIYIQEAVAALSPDHRETLELAYWQGMTHPEIARRTRVPLGTVKSRLHHALSRLRNLLVTDGREGGKTSGRY